MTQSPRKFLAIAGSVILLVVIIVAIIAVYQIDQTPNSMAGSVKHNAPAIRSSQAQIQSQASQPDSSSSSIKDSSIIVF